MSSEVTNKSFVFSSLKCDVNLVRSIYDSYVSFDVLVCTGAVVSMIIRTCSNKFATSASWVSLFMALSCSYYLTLLNGCLF